METMEKTIPNIGKNAEQLALLLILGNNAEQSNYFRKQSGTFVLLYTPTII